jgi:exopolysaccharide biosynthesis polyprenyl glycosylphosphotransferase
MEARVVEADQPQPTQDPDRRPAAAPPRVALGFLVFVVDVITLASSSIVLLLARDFQNIPLLIAYPITAVLVLTLSGAYQPRILPRLSEDLGPLFGRLCVAFVIVAAFLAQSAEELIPAVDALKPDEVLRPRRYDLGTFASLLVIPIMLVLLGRMLAYVIIRGARRQGYLTEPTLIIGARNLGVKVASTLLEHPEYGLVPVGFLDSIGDAGLPLPVLGEVRELETAVKAFGIRRVVVAFGAMPESQMVRTLRASDQLPVEVHVVPRFFELGVTPEGPLTDDLWGIPLQRLRRSALRTVAWRTKRVFDLVIGSAFLILALPLLGCCAVAVRLSSPGPVFFRQRRIGQRGEVFQLLKFRTMTASDDSDVTWISPERRITRVGRILRATSLDELPQLFNVLRGEMSLVGPRPERPHFVDRFRVAVQGYDDRHRVPTGMTGWAQVHGLRGDTSIVDRALFDNYYVEHWSLWHDVLILFRTLTQVFKRGGG